MKKMLLVALLAGTANLAFGFQKCLDMSGSNYYTSVAQQSNYYAILSGDYSSLPGTPPTISLSTLTVIGTAAYLGCPVTIGWAQQWQDPTNARTYSWGNIMTLIYADSSYGTCAYNSGNVQAVCQK